MTNMNDLSQLQRKANLSYAEDGLPELLAGILLCSLFGWLLLDRIPWGGMMPVLALMFVAVLRRVIRYPRVGYMRPTATLAPGPGRAVLSVVIIVFTLGVLGWLVLGRTSILAVPQATMQLALGTAAVLVFACTGIYLGLGRWYAYAGLIAVAMLTAMACHAQAAYGVLAAGALLVAWSLVLLVRFVRKYPVLERNEDIQLGKTMPGSRN